jgi:hypothetical protein
VSTAASSPEVGGGRTEEDVERSRRCGEPNGEQKCHGIPTTAHPPSHLPAEQGLHSGSPEGEPGDEDGRECGPVREDPLPYRAPDIEGEGPPRKREGRHEER